MSADVSFVQHACHPPMEIAFGTWPEDLTVRVRDWRCGICGEFWKITERHGSAQAARVQRLFNRRLTLWRKAHS